MIEGINAEAVTQWLCESVDCVAAPLEFSLIAGGHSNLTYRVVDARGRELVLRRPPLGHVLESAHDMGREYKIIAALVGSTVPVASYSSPITPSRPSPAVKPPLPSVSR